MLSSQRARIKGCNLRWKERACWIFNSAAKPANLKYTRRIGSGSVLGLVEVKVIQMREPSMSTGRNFHEISPPRFLKVLSVVPVAQVMRMRL